MADQRTYDLTAITSGDLATLLSTLVLDMDDPSYSAGQSKKLALATLLNSDVISANTNVSQAITQKAFYDSVATDARLGILKHATPTEINDGAAGNLAVIASELKRKLDEITTTSAIAFSGTPSSSITIVQLSGRKSIKTQSITGSIAVSSGVASQLFVQNITGYISPGYSYWFTLQATVATNENGIGVIETNGNLSIWVFKTGVWMFNATPIGI